MKLSRGRRTITAQDMNDWWSSDLFKRGLKLIQEQANMPVNNGKPESDAIKRARQDINERAAELERAQQAAAAAGVKLQAAQDALAKLLEKQTNAKK